VTCLTVAARVRQLHLQLRHRLDLQQRCSERRGRANAQRHKHTPRR
jgi:hypothetical protein